MILPPMNCKKKILVPPFDDPKRPVVRCIFCGTKTRQEDGECVPCRTGIRMLSKELGPAPKVDWPEPEVKRYAERTCLVCGSSFIGGWAAKYCSGECRYRATKRRWKTRKRRNGRNGKHD